ncbi:MAG: fumarylacetoacetate hydrolase family protein [Burkholderiales bacterium]|jgi:2-keto-4-pentenoate hydratase/2-oxohepta-3-ene-1,7-dioic acid hydratase in catechol pathway|nr:fumarylacetoacetate hydrolase family protein [Burkholderiales bacterium]
MKWIRFDRSGVAGFGVLGEGEVIAVHSGDMFADAKPTGETVKLGDVKVLAPTVPTKMVALWNNFHALAAKLGNPVPPEPLYFLKGNNSFAAANETIRKPAAYDGKVIFEGELGVVIGRRAAAVSEADAPGCIFGYTIINDVTAVDILKKDPTFDQWTRAKSFDTFGPFGPVIATGVDPLAASVKVVLNDQERQNYPLGDLVFTPAQLVSRISHDMTLFPGDVIACGTSVGVGTMKPGSTVSVTIDGIGTLTNRYE